MTDQEQKDILELALQRGLKLHNESIMECLVNIEESSSDKLANLAIFGQPLDFNGVKYLFELSGIGLSDSELLAWLVNYLELNLFQKIALTGDNTVLWQLRDEVCAYFSTHSKSEDLKRYHRNADKFILEQLASFATEIEFVLPDDDTRRASIIGPNNFLDQIAHLPQHQEFHKGILNLALNWFDHLFFLEEYKEAAEILNSICFALARRGQRKMAENMLATVAGKTKGLTSVVAQVNLATLLREEQQISTAMQLYWRSIPKLLGQKAYFQLAQVLTEMAAIYRQVGNLTLSAIILEISVMLNSCLKNRKSAAIARSQLASTFRSLKIYSLALRNSRLAVGHFRETDDLLNLGRSLLTQGNIYYNLLKSDLAIQCFNEALEIGQRISDPQAEIGSTSGKARVFLLLKQFDEAQSLLNQAISLRERHNDHNIGIEYQNMGALHEQKGEFAMALGWYQKALIQFEKFDPGSTSSCRSNIAVVQAKYRGK